jgi:hypothetical protein
VPQGANFAQEVPALVVIILMVIVEAEKTANYHD